MRMLEKVLQHVRDTAKLESVMALLEWDDHTYIPSQGGGFRAEQVTMLSEIVHHRRTDPELGDRLRELAQQDVAKDRSTAEGCAIQCLLRDYEKHAKLPVDLVSALAKATTLGQQAWVKARSADSWEDFRPHLQEIVRLRREEAALLRSPNGSLYDAMIDQYEEGARSQELTTIFALLRDGLVKLLQDIQSAKKPPTGTSWKRKISVHDQATISQWIASSIGYDFSRGRLDETAHPFCTTLGPNDCRILTRYDEDYLPTSFYGSLHEAGHGLYEQGLPTEWYGLPPGCATSLGVHESQSRLWENFVGRSAEFWNWCGPQLKRQLGTCWSGVDLSQLFSDANLVENSLIRVEADEVTYNLHILIRFELEQELFSGNLSVEDAPQAWNDRYERYLGIKSSNFRDGILQDVHWSAGLMGYFPTYTLGNLYAAQMMQVAESQIGNLRHQWQNGEFRPLLDWLRVNVHAHGRRYTGTQLLQRIVNKPLSAEPLLQYLRSKLEVAYGMA